MVMEKIASTRGLISAACAAVLVFAGSLPAPAQADPVWYEIDMWAGNASGTLNGVPFSNADIQMDFFGDTSTVQPFSAPNPDGSTTTGYINPTSSSASFGIYAFDPNSWSYTTVGTGSFLPDANIYVSVDNTNGGIGFGSIPPGSSGFGQPVYPGGLLVPACCVSPNVATYDLTTSTFIDAYQISCWGWPDYCVTGQPLDTTMGQLVLNQITVGTPGYFNAQVFSYSALQPMSSMKASVAVRSMASGSTGTSALNQFRVQGSFVLGAGAEKVDPAKQDVLLRLGKQAFKIPAGSFKGSNKTGYLFQGKVDGAVLRAVLTRQSATDYSFQVDASGVPPLGEKFPVRLAIGPAVGRTMVKPGKY